MADIQDSDQFLVNRSDSTATVTAATLMADLLDDDLMLVNRSNATYTVTGAEVKASIGGGGGKEIYPEVDEITITPAPQGGSGTSIDPFILKTVDARPAGATGNTVEVITIDVAGAKAGDLVVFTNNSVGSGNRFNQPTRVVELDGSWSGRLVYFDTPDSTSDTDYVGDLRIGDVYFRWTVEQGIDPVRPIKPDPDEITANPDFQGGTGTQGDPYLLESITVAPAGGYGQSVELITIAEVGAQEGHLVRWTDNSVGAANRFAQPEGFVGADGTWTGRLVYNDIPDSAADQIYTGDLQIGETYFRWVVDQQFAANTAPEIGSVSLVEQNPNTAPRFTDQEFVATVDMTEQGVPQSIKTIDAYVQGAITTEVQFDEPLESSTTSSGLPATTWSDFLTAPSGVNNPGNAFDGTPNRSTATGGLEIMTFTLPSAITGQIAVDTGLGGARHEIYTNNSLTSTVNALNSGIVAWDVTNATSVGLKCLDQQTGITGIYLDGAQFLNGQAMPGGGVSSIDLVFAAGTNMTTLAAGDAVSQEEREIAPGQDFTNGGTFQFGGQTTDLDNKQATFDGNEFDQAYGRPDLDYSGATGTVAYVFANPIPVQTLQLGLLIGSGFTQEININASANWHTVTNNFINATDFLEGATQLTSLAVRQTATSTVTGPVYFFSRIIVDDNVLKDGVPVTVSANGTVGSITDTAVTLSSSSGTWTNGINVTGPQKTITGDNVKKYLKFDSSGNVSDLLNSPQEPAYETTNENPSLTLTFPSTFPSGNAPDAELGDGTTLTVCATATNAAGLSGPACDTVQPASHPPVVQFNEPLESYGQEQGPTWSDGTVQFLGNWGNQNNTAQSFNGNYLNAMSSSRVPSSTSEMQGATWQSPQAINNVTELFYYADDIVGNFFNCQFSVNNGTWTLITPTTGDPSTNDYRFDLTSLIGGTTVTSIGCQLMSNGVSFQTPRFATVIKINGKVLLDNDPTYGDTTLTFATGTDMTTLDAGDAVEQPSGAVIPATYWSNNLSGTGLGGVTNIFNGFASGASGYANGKLTFTIGQTVSGKFTITFPAGTTAVHNIYVNDIFQKQQSVPGSLSIDFDAVSAASIGIEKDGGSFTDVCSFSLNGQMFINDQPLVIMAADGVVGSISDTTVTLSTSNGGWVDGLNVVGPDKTPFRSLTQEEFNKQAVKFGTYENRRDVYQGEQAMAQRAHVARVLEDQYGVTPDMIEESLPPMNQPAPTKRSRKKKTD